MKLSTLITLAVAAQVLAGCASMPSSSRVEQAITPDSISAVVAHVGHITTAVEPPLARAFGADGDDPTYDTVGLSAQWSHGPLWLEVSDGYAVYNSALAGPREVFSASIGYTLWTSEGR